MARTFRVFTATVTSPANATPSATVIAEGLASAYDLEIEADLLGATGDELDICIQRSLDGTTYSDWIRFPRLTAAASVAHFHVVPSDQSSISTVGTSATAITINPATIIPGHWQDRLRVVCVPGASTSAGAVQTFRLLYNENPATS